MRLGRLTANPSSTRQLTETSLFRQPPVDRQSQSSSLRDSSDFILVTYVGLQMEGRYALRAEITRSTQFGRYLRTGRIYTSCSPSGARPCRTVAAGGLRMVHFTFFWRGRLYLTLTGL